MAEFCKCGSIMIDGSCTRKNCSNKLEKVTPSRSRTASVKTPAIKTTSSIKATTIKTDVKSTKVRRASKCITYSINDLPKNESRPPV